MRKLKSLWIPLAVVVGFYFYLAFALFGAHSYRPARHCRRSSFRPPPLFQNGEVARVARTHQKVFIRAIRWDGNGYIYAVVPIK